ncbi:Protein GVQW1 [Plecturocebus cupreus]
MALQAKPHSVAKAAVQWWQSWLTAPSASQVQVQGRIFQVEETGQVLKAETSHRKKAHRYSVASRGIVGLKQSSCFSLSSWDYRRTSLGQAALELMDSSDPPILASQSSGITGVSHHT